RQRHARSSPVWLPIFQADDSRSVRRPAEYRPPRDMPGTWRTRAVGGSASGHFFSLGLPLLAGRLIPAGPLAMQWAAPADQLGPVGLVAAHADHLVPRPGPAAHQSRFELPRPVTPQLFDGREAMTAECQNRC